MGLDMYLNQRHYVENWDFMKPEERHEITITKGGKPTNIPTDKIVYIETRVCYWRKANAIHQWFVKNCQDGIDECQTVSVSRDKLQQLLDTVTKVLDTSTLVVAKIKNGYSMNENGTKRWNYEDGKRIKNPAIAKELLPTQEGFFFGSYDYDEYYFQDLQETKEALTKALSDPDAYNFTYRSSW